MKKYLILLLICSANVSASVNCIGTIDQVYKWDNFESISILVNLNSGGRTNWISMPTKSDESMALMAFASGKNIRVYMSEDSVTNCIDGWAHNKKLKGYFLIEK